MERGEGGGRSYTQTAVVLEKRSSQQSRHRSSKHLINREAAVVISEITWEKNKNQNTALYATVR